MPIYEFYCESCNVIYQFFARSAANDRRPDCPRCGRKRLEKRPSGFAVTGRAKEPSAGGGDDIDDARMERAMEALAGEADGLNTDDPRNAARLMRKFAEATGMKSGAMEEAMRRLEAGEDPDAVEAELGPALDAADPFGAEKSARPSRPAPRRDETLYDL